ncbi:MAG: PKD domain-containing protein [Myxococcales bacterium]
MGIAAWGGDIYVADSQNQRVCQIDPGGNVTTVAGGTVGYADGLGTAARLYQPTGLAAGDGALWVVDTGNRLIRRIALDGSFAVSTVAGDAAAAGNGQGGFADGPAGSALLVPLAGLADVSGNLLIADTGNERVRILQGGQLGTYAGSGLAGSADGPGAAATFSLPTGVAALPDGTLAIADEGDSTIRLLEPSGAGGSGGSSSSGGAGSSGSTSGGSSGSGGGGSGGGSPPMNLVLTANPGAGGPAPFWVELDGTGSTTADPNDWIASFTLDTGDGARTADGWIDHTYQTPGAYLAMLTATDGYGNVQSTSVTIAVASSGSNSGGSSGSGGASGSGGSSGGGGGAMNLVLTADPGFSGAAPFWVELDGTSSTASDPNDWIASFALDTGDGARTTDGWIDHTYQAPGTYTVTLTATDGYGSTQAITRTIVVQ